MINKILFFLIFLLPMLCASKLCSEQKCVRNSVTSRIAGGGVSDRQSRPFQVAIYSRVGTTGELGFCGGSLVQPQWVLTSAHCCFHDGQLVDNVQVILGAHSLYDRYENGRRIMNVAAIEVHPEFDPETFTNDIALMQLANTFQITDTIDIVRLPYLSTVNFNLAGASAIASGWGIAAEGVNFVSPTLRQFNMTVITDPQCDNWYQNQLPPDAICGFSTASGTCKGDNGGPMTLFNNTSEETILIGVASFVNINGCNTGIPSVFTRVQRHLDWISEVTGMEHD